MTVDKELLKGCSKTIVLQLLSKKGMHGYELSQKLKQSTSGKIEITEGTLYPLLHALEADGSITSNWLHVVGQRRRKVYTITTKGKKLLKEKTKEWQEFLSTMELLLPAKYSFGGVI